MTSMISTRVHGLAAVHPMGLITRHPDQPTKELDIMGDTTTTTTASGYTIAREAPEGYMVVRYNGVKVGQTQTRAAAGLMRRNHMRRNNNA